MPNERMDFIRGLLSNFLFSLSRGLQTQAQTPGPPRRQSMAGFGASLGGPFELQELQRQQAEAQKRLGLDERRLGLDEKKLALEQLNMKIRQANDARIQREAEERAQFDRFNALAQLGVPRATAGQPDFAAVPSIPAEGPVQAMPMPTPQGFEVPFRMGLPGIGNVAVPTAREKFMQMLGQKRAELTAEAPFQAPVHVPAGSEIGAMPGGRPAIIEPPRPGPEDTFEEKFIKNALEVERLNRGGKTLDAVSTNAAIGRARAQWMQFSRDPGMASLQAEIAQLRIESLRRVLDGPLPTTDGERRDLGYYIEAKQASDVQEALEQDIQKLGTMGQIGVNWLPNMMQTQLGQSYNAAVRAFSEARLRRVSGATIKQEEIDETRRTYFVQPGDSAATIAQKRVQRDRILEGLKIGAGRAYKNAYPDSMQPERLKLDFSGKVKRN